MCGSLKLSLERVKGTHIRCIACNSCELTIFLLVEHVDGEEDADTGSARAWKVLKDPEAESDLVIGSQIGIKVC